MQHETITLTATPTPVLLREPAPPWRVWDAVLVVAGMIGLSLAASLFMPAGWSRTPSVLVGVHTVWELLTIAAAVAVVIVRGGRVWRWLAGRAFWLVEAALGVAFIVPLILLGIAVGLVTRAALGPPDAGQRAALFIGQLTLTPRLVMAFSAIVLAPLAEEMLFRGLLLSSLRARTTWWAAWLIQAAAFATLHRDSLQATISLFAIGLGLGAVYLWRRSLVTTVIMHAGFNTLPMLWMIALVWINQHTPAATWEEAERPPSWYAIADAASPAEPDDEGGPAPRAAEDHAARGDPPLGETFNHSAYAWWRQQAVRHATASDQWQEALNLGSRGVQLWKVEILAFEDIIRQFPEDAEFSSLALAGIQQAYLHFLHDPRRAIVTGRRLLEQYPDQRTACARATVASASAYLELGDSASATRLAEQAAADFSDLPEIAAAAQTLLEELQERSADQ